MTPNQPAERTRATETEWPSFELEYAFNPGVADVELAPDEVVVYDRRSGISGARWIAAERGSYVPVEETR
ncbi:hypothetical protein [Halegenticoccus soli]|uniref:hypothetical protein n=1 Tax=Halegenticoccus soli TaxID=1985678 RepID=UPI000C6E7B29|nr:hypothetical protein [Halegenticoccus soli]